MHIAKIFKYLGISVLIIFALLALLFFYAIFLNPNPHSTSTYRNYLRLRTIRSLSSSLEIYFSDNQKYPKNLTDLLPNYTDTSWLNAWPHLDIKNSPCPKNDSLNYETNAVQNDFKIRFCLPENDKQYKAGYYIATKDVIKKE